MRKYHLADALTAIEVFMAVLILGMAIFKVSADYAIWAFAIGELCDAYDGICARRWPYPDDGKYRWWRVPSTVQAIEHGSDVAILVVCAIYLCTGPVFLIRILTAVCGSLIALICYLVEVELQTDDFYLLQPKRAKELILWRRKYIYPAGIVFGVAFLIFSTSWTLYLKLACCALGICIGIYLWHKKRPRREDI